MSSRIHQAAKLFQVSARFTDSKYSKAFIVNDFLLFLILKSEKYAK
jgi:hypothetical protein